MDTGTLSGLFTALLMTCFLGVAIWAFSTRRRDDFDRAAQLPLADREEDRP